MPNAQIEPVRNSAEERQLAEELERYQEARAFLSQQRVRLTRQYPNQWVAIHRGKLVMHSPRLTDVKRKIRQLGFHRSHVLVEFLTEERQSYIL